MKTARTLGRCLKDSTPQNAEEKTRQQQMALLLLGTSEIQWRSVSAGELLEQPGSARSWTPSITRLITEDLSYVYRV